MLKGFALAVVFLLSAAACIVAMGWIIASEREEQTPLERAVRRALKRSRT